MFILRLHYGIVITICFSFKTVLSMLSMKDSNEAPVADVCDVPFLFLLTDITRDDPIVVFTYKHEGKPLALLKLYNPPNPHCPGRFQNPWHPHCPGRFRNPWLVEFVAPWPTPTSPLKTSLVHGRAFQNGPELCVYFRWFGQKSTQHFFNLNYRKVWCDSCYRVEMEAVASHGASSAFMEHYRIPPAPPSEEQLPAPFEPRPSPDDTQLPIPIYLLSN